MTTAADLDALVAACLAAPWDEAPRLVLADACCDRGLDRAEAVLRLGHELLKAADDPAWDWVPPVVHHRVHAPDGGVYDTAWHQRLGHECVNNVWYRHHSHTQPWFPLPRRPAKWYGRVFAVAACRFVISRWPDGATDVVSNFIPHSLEMLAACEVSAAGLISPRERDGHLDARLPVHWSSGKDKAFHGGAEVGGIWRPVAMARSGHVGHVQHAIHALTTHAYIRRRPPPASSDMATYWYRRRAAFLAEHCAGGWHLKTLLRMARRLRAHLGCDT